MDVTNLEYIFGQDVPLIITQSFEGRFERSGGTVEVRGILMGWGYIGGWEYTGGVVWSGDTVEGWYTLEWWGYSGGMELQWKVGMVERWIYGGGVDE